MKLRDDLVNDKLMMISYFDKFGHTICLMTQNLLMYEMPTSALNGTRLDLTNVTKPVHMKHKLEELYNVKDFKEWHQNGQIVNIAMINIDAPESPNDPTVVVAHKKFPDNETFPTLVDMLNSIEKVQPWTGMVEDHGKFTQQGAWIAVNYSIRNPIKPVDGISYIILSMVISSDKQHMLVSAYDRGSQLFFGNKKFHIKVANSTSTGIHSNDTTWKMCFLIDNQTKSSKIVFANKDADCSTSHHQKTLQQTTTPTDWTIKRGIMMHDNFYLFCDQGVYIFPVVTWRNPGQPQPLTKLTYDQFLHFPGVTPPPQIQSTTMNASNHSTMDNLTTHSLVIKS